MDDKQSGNNIFDLYTSNQLQDRVAETNTVNQSEPLTYAALEIEGDKQQSWLCLHEANGLIRLLPYHSIRHVICIPFAWVGVQFSDAILTLEGHNLVPIVRLIQTQQLAAIHCFSDSYPALPEDEEMPIIHQMRLQSHTEAEAEIALSKEE